MGILQLTEDFFACLQVLKESSTSVASLDKIELSLCVRPVCQSSDSLPVMPLGPSGQVLPQMMEYLPPPQLVGSQ